jgi:CheY-like chemotaxis protein/HPt (histidine-containing phosphotransfer) domain-containing protein
MGGRITVESEPGRGSTFSFTARLSRSSKPEWSGMSGRGPLEGLEVLVVDDHKTSREIMASWLVQWRMRPTEAADAASAFEVLERAQRSGSPGPLVLLDGQMPEIDGITLAGKIRERFGPSAHRLILLSSDQSPALEARSREAGIAAYLVKPVQASELLDTIWEVMSASPNLGPGTRAREVAVAKPRIRGLHVLVAEDNELNVNLLIELLGQRDHRVEVAGDGNTALELASRTDDAFDLMLLDLHMPEMDGFEVVRAIRDRERGTAKRLPIIALTARSSARDRDMSLAAGMDAFLAKPLDADALWAAIERIVVEVPSSQRRRLIDARVIAQTCGGRASVLDRLCETFRQGVPAQVAAARSALEARDFTQLRKAAHILAGTLSAFSTIAGTLASTLEDIALDQDVERCRALVGDLESTCARVVEETRGLRLEDLQS